MTKGTRARRATQGTTATKAKASKQASPKGESFEVEYAPLDSIRPYGKNPRRISDTAIRKVAESLQEDGWQQVILVDENREIIAGHVRRLAALSLGWTTGPIKIAKGMSPARVRAFRIRDNRVSEESTWDDPVLAMELSDLRLDGVDLASTGMSPADLARLLDGSDGKSSAGSAPEIGFTDELFEEHQYVILYFDNGVDWQTAQETFKIANAKALDAKEGYVRKGVGRIIRGADVLKMIQQ